jgi:hypothetical protein
MPPQSEPKDTESEELALVHWELFWTADCIPAKPQAPVIDVPVELGVRDTDAVLAQELAAARNAPAPARPEGDPGDAEVDEEEVYKESGKEPVSGTKKMWRCLIIGSLDPKTSQMRTKGSRGKHQIVCIYVVHLLETNTFSAYAHTGTYTHQQL